MSTRSKTRKASTSQAPPASPVVAKPDPRPRKKTIDSNAEQENATMIIAKATSKTKVRKTEKTPTKEVNCICSGEDDGSPMVRCALCYIWCVLCCVVLANSLLMTRQVSFHVRGFVRTRGGGYKCVPFHFLTFCVFNDLQGIFVCPSCTESTGRRTISEYLKPFFLKHRHIYIVIPRYVVVKSQTCRIMPRITLSFASTISGVLFLSSWRYMRGLVISCTCPLWRRIGAS